MKSFVFFMAGATSATVIGGVVVVKVVTRILEDEDVRKSVANLSFEKVSGFLMKGQNRFADRVFGQQPTVSKYRYRFAR